MVINVLRSGLLRRIEFLVEDMAEIQPGRFSDCNWNCQRNLSPDVDLSSRKNLHQGILFEAKGRPMARLQTKPCGRLRATERETERSRRRVAIRPAWRAPVAILRRLSVRFGDMRRSAADWVAGNLTSSDRHYRAAVLATSGDGRQPHKHEQAPCVYRCCALWPKYPLTST